MNTWWLERNPRERLVLKLAAVAAALMLGWAFILQPMDARQSSLNARIAAQQATLMQLEEARILLANQSTGQAVTTNLGGRSLASVVEQGLRMAGLAGAIRRIEPAGENYVSVVLEQASFDALVGWLQDAHAETGLAVSELNLDAGERPGAVSARIRVQAGQ